MVKLLLTTLMAGVIALPVMLQGQSSTPSITDINYGNWVKIAQAPDDAWMHFPRALSYDVSNGGNIVKKALVSWNTTADAVSFTVGHEWMGSLNAGITWNSPSRTNANNQDVGTCIRRLDGVLISLPFFPANFNGGNPVSTFTFTYDTSADNGATWHPKTNGGLVTGFGSQLMGTFRFHRGIIQDANGDLYAPAYVQFRLSDGSYESHRAILMKSTNKGATWTYLSTIQATTGISYNETSIVRCRDGSILAVMRNGSNPLKYRRSTDNGVSWNGAVTLVPGLPTNIGVDPYLYMMPNGVLVLSYGDNISGSNMRNCYLAFAPDGVGNNWTNVIATYTSSTSGLGNKSSGYTAVFPTRVNRFLQTSDRALYTYYGTNQHPTPNPFSIWSKQADVVLNFRNRIDLATKYANGDITVTTDMTYANATHPEARIAGAFDGSTDYWSSAFKSGSSGTMTIDLKYNQLINAIGVCLATGVPQSATIDYSTDGSTWTNIRTYGAGTVHYTIDYTSLASVISARYIRINTSGSGLTGLNEIRLFSAADTYEDYAQNVAPVGYSLLDYGFWVSEGVLPTPTGYKSLRALFMNDSDDGNKEISKTGFTAAAQKTLDFYLRVKSFAATNGAVQWRMVSGSTNAFRMRVVSSGAVQYYNGSNYVTISGANIPIDTWTHITVSANATTGAGILTINDSSSYPIGKEATVSTLNGFLFASGGSTPVGDAALFDDVAFYDTPSGARIQSRETTTGAPAPLQVAPNPASDGYTTISYAVKEESIVHISVYNLLGQKEEDLLNIRQQAGHYNLRWNTTGKTPGVYIVRVIKGNKTEKAKVILK